MACTLKIPVIRGMIDRRILANWRVDPAVLAGLLPPPFRPQIVDGRGIAGVCLIRLKQVRPALMPSILGVGSENAAHRIAVEWEENGQLRNGVYIPRRDTNSRLAVLTGGRIFPGVQHHATFDVDETPDRVRVGLLSDDRQTRVRIAGRVATEIGAGSVFGTLKRASEFFAAGSLGYSATESAGRFDGLELRCDTWEVQALDVEIAESSFFDDRDRFPEGTAHFDCALLMRGIEHEWHGKEQLCCAAHNTAAASTRA